MLNNFSKKAIILLQDGTSIDAKSFGADKTVCAELVFNTGMTGYQEVLTDPSYAGQAVIMTYPLIGNYGINPIDTQSSSVKLSALVVKDFCRQESNWKSTKNISDYLKEENIPAIFDVDTRMLTRKIRSHGTMNCLITTEDLNNSHKTLLDNFIFPSDIVHQVSRTELTHIKGNSKKIAIIDYGIKSGIIKFFSSLDCDITIFPSKTGPEEILNKGFKAVVLSNGPGDPKDVTEAIELTRSIAGKITILGICLGHQIIALALGGDTYKLKFGHRGSNHPVIDLKSSKVFITSQNHGYAVKEENLPDNILITHKNVNDGTVEGLSFPSLNIHSVQFHPEAGPGPADANFIFQDWFKLI